MKLYSYKGQEPEELPYRIRLDNGETRTSLSELSKKDLRSIGFLGPITKPVFEETTQKLQWDGTQYTIVSLTEEEILKKQIELKKQKIKEIDYNQFWEKFVITKFYKKIQFFASQSLEVNVIYTELILLFNDAKNKNVDISSIQKCVNILFLIIEFDDQEIEELQKTMEETKLDLIYTLPDKSYNDNYMYDSISKSIIKKSPFDSWSLVNGKWQPPIQYPTDGKIYNWDETLKNWILLK